MILHLLTTPTTPRARLHSYGVQARLNSRTRGLFFHGTSTKYLRKILKLGLQADPGHRQYDDEKGRGSGVSIKTFGGAYLTHNPNSTMQHASGAVSKRGGNELYVACTYDTRSDDVLIDEDHIVTRIGESTYGLMLDNGFGYSLRQFSKWGGLMASDYEAVIYHLEHKLTEEDAEREIGKFSEPRVQKRMRQVSELVLDVARAKALHHLENHWDEETKHTIRRVEKWRADYAKNGGYKATRKEMLQTIKKFDADLEGLKHKPAGITNTWGRLNRAVTELSRRVKALNDVPKRSFAHNIRISQSLTYKGKNRILAVMEVGGRRGAEATWIKYHFVGRGAQARRAKKALFEMVREGITLNFYVLDKRTGRVIETEGDPKPLTELVAASLRSG